MMTRRDKPEHRKITDLTTRKMILLPFAIMSFVYIQFSIFHVDDGSYDNWTDYSPDTFSTTTSKSLGRRIVERAFDESFGDLVKYCNKPSYTQPELKTCLAELYQKTNNKTLPYARKWPWWFQTMMRDASKPRGELFGKWHILQFKDPRLQLCVIEKAGTKEFRNFHCHTINKTDERDLFHCYQVQGDLLPNSDKSIFLRDPLDRFLSGFLDKCIRYRHIEPHCEPLMVFDNLNTSLVKDFYSNNQKLFEAYVDAMPLTWNLHYFPQSLYCGGLFNEIQNYSFVGSMGPDFYQDLNRYAEQYPKVAPFLDDEFKMSEKENTTNVGVENRAASKTLAFYTPHTVRRVLEFFSIDYVTLNLTIPEWAEHMLANDSILP